MDISPVIIVKDAERTIAKTLESLKEFDEVIVYDTGSSDKTMEIATTYRNVVLVRAIFEGFSESKNKAAKIAKNDWILSIDADEVISPELMDSIRELSPEEGITYRFKRNNYYRNKIIKYSGWGREYVIRIYKRTSTCFNKKLVHEHIDCDLGSVRTINGELRHYSYHSISNFVTKRDLYSELFAIENKGLRKSSPFLALIRGAFDFLNTFFIKLGFLDGYRGILISVSNANVTFYKYLKLYEANICNAKSISLIVNCGEGGESVLPTLKSALSQSLPPDEIIVVGNKNFELQQEEVESLSKKCFIPLSYVFNQKKSTEFDVLEQGIAKSKYEYLVFVDSNTLMTNKFICNHVSSARKGAFVTNRCINVDKTKFQELNNSKELKSTPIILSFIKVLSKKVRTLFGNSNGIFVSNIDSFSFYKENYIIRKGDERKIKDTHEKLEFRLKKLGLRKRNTFNSEIQYCHKSLNKKKVLVCLDRLKFINCGLGQVALNFGRELLNVDSKEFDIVFLLPSKGFKEFERRVNFVKLNILKSVFSNYMRKYDLCHVTHQLPSYSFGGSNRNILTIHDLNFLFTKSRTKSRRYLKQLQRNIDKSDTIVFISDFTKQITCENLEIPESKSIKVVHNGVRVPGNSTSRPTWLPNKKFFFSIGQFLEKKNFHVLLPFMKFFPNDFLLIVAGENHTNYGQKMRQIVADLDLGDRVIFPGGISEEDKGYLYHNCEAFLFPSIAEGFGLPVIEAMLCSKPVFCSDRTSLREIGGEFAFFWKDFEPEKMHNILVKGMETFREKDFKERQKEYADSFTYARNVREYLELYQEFD